MATNVSLSKVLINDKVNMKLYNISNDVVISFAVQ